MRTIYLLLAIFSLSITLHSCSPDEIDDTNPKVVADGVDPPIPVPLPKPVKP